MLGDNTSSAVEMCKRSLLEHISQLEKDIINFNEMLNFLKEGDGKYIPTLKI